VSEGFCQPIGLMVLGNERGDLGSEIGRDGL